MRPIRLAAALILASLFALPAAGQSKVTSGVVGAGSSRLNPIPVQLDSLRQLRVTTRGRVLGDEVIPTGGLRGPCAPTTSSHTDANFTGGSFVVQAGFGEGEMFASTYPFTVPSGVQLPAQIKIDSMEFILATSGSTVQTTTRYSILVYIGTPTNGTLVWSQTSSQDPGDLPDAVIPPGTNGINIQVSIDPGDPEQIILTNNGSNQFTIAFRIDDHNNQTANPCFQGPPTSSNAFPCTDTSGLSQPSRNWLFGLNCGALGCPANGGWSTFAALPGFCRPSGDTVMRATWEFLNCQTAVGSCCTGQICTITTQSECTSGGGSYRGDNTTCGTPCPIPTGSCCINGSCSIQTQADCTAANGQYRGDNTTCATPCPTPQGACCFSNNNCLVLSPTDCAAVPGTYLGTGVNCGAGNTCPTGACCLPSGNCITTTPPGCALISGAIFRGIGVACAGANCPQPTGACCTSSGGCIAAQTQANCGLIPGATWQGAGTVCPCCRPDWDHNGVLQPADVAAFINTWSQSLQQGTLAGDYDSSGVVNPADVSAFINDWFGRLNSGGC